MALSTKAGAFVLNTANGNQSITGVGFQPKAIMFWGVRATAADEAGASYITTFGVATSSTARGCISTSGNDAAATTVEANRTEIVRCFTNITGAGALREAADFVSFDADGFTINMTNFSAAAYMNYLALGGDDLTGVAVTNFLSEVTTGDKAYTGLGFQPDCLIGITTNRTAAGSSSSSAQFSLGVATAADAQRACGISSRHNEDISDTRRVQVDSFLAAVSTTGDTVPLEASVVSFDADGFTLNWEAVFANGRVCIVLALAGGQYKVGIDTQKTSTGTKSTTGVGFLPTALLTSSVNNTASASLATHARLSIGAASSTTARKGVWMGNEDAAGTSVVDHIQSSDTLLIMGTEGTPTVNAEADLASFDADGFTLDWESADGTSREFVYLAMGSEPAGGETYNETASGGAVCGGSAAPTSIYAPAASGGVVCAGSVVASFAYTETATGGAVCNGTGTIHTTFVYVVAGGVVCDGTAARTTEYTESASGGVVCNGTVFQPDAGIRLCATLSVAPIFSGTVSALPAFTGEVANTQC